MNTVIFNFMKAKNGYWTYTFLIMFFFVLILGCNEDDLSNEETVTDFDGNIYNTVIIGNQIWMAENLATTRYNDGTEIPLVTDSLTWGNLSTPAYCWYGNDEIAYKNIYGALYNWYTVKTDKLCPKDWHVPTGAEWINLINYIETDGKTEAVGTALKAETGWLNDSNGTDNYGFAALPGGYRGSNGTFNINNFFSVIGNYGAWWSSTEEYSPADAVDVILEYNNDDIILYSDYKGFGLSVRCIKD